MTHETFQNWVKASSELLTAAPAHRCRHWAEELRPHDPELAAIYDRMADNHDALRKHLMSKQLG